MINRIHELATIIRNAARADIFLDVSDEPGLTATAEALQAAAEELFNLTAHGEITPLVVHPNDSTGDENRDVWLHFNDGTTVLGWAGTWYWRVYDDESVNAWHKITPEEEARCLGWSEVQASE